MIEFDYYKFWKSLGIKKGEILDIASDLTIFIYYCKKNNIIFNPDELIDSLKDIVTSKGTIMIRTFNWDFCKGVPFDVKNTPSKVGQLGNVALDRNDFKRTKHPLYSWAVWGKYTNELCNLNNISGFGENSPFEFLYKKNGLQVTIGNTSVVGLTQIHYCEYLARVPYRKNKIFTGMYIDENAIKTERKYSMLVRPLNVDVSNDMINKDDFSSFLLKNDVMLKGKYNNVISFCKYDLQKLTKCVLNNLLYDGGNLVVSINGVPGYENSHIDWGNVNY